MRRVEGDQNISLEFLKSYFRNQNGTTIATPCHGTYMHLQNFRKFFLLVTHYLLSKAPYVCSFGLAWSIHGSYAQGLWLSGTVDLVVCSCSVLLLSVCLQVPVLLSGSTLVLDPWLSWLVSVVW